MKTPLGLILVCFGASIVITNALKLPKPAVGFVSLDKGDDDGSDEGNFHSHFLEF